MRAAASLLPDNANALTLSGFARLAGPDGADPKAAETTLTRALIAAPGDPRALAGLERLYGDLARRPEAASPYSRGDLARRVEALESLRERPMR